jgi:hypothetical protein
MTETSLALSVCARRAENFKHVFNKFDKDLDGKLTYDEFSRGLKQLGLILPEKEIRAIWGGGEFNDKAVKWQEMEDQIAAKSRMLQSAKRSPVSSKSSRQVCICYVLVPEVRMIPSTPKTYGTLLLPKQSKRFHVPAD